MDEIERVNIDLELVVRDGIAVSHELGLVCAWIYMTNSGVNESTILRVLLHEDKRRATDAVALEIAQRNNRLPILRDKSPSISGEQPSAEMMPDAGHQTSQVRTQPFD